MTATPAPTVFTTHLDLARLPWFEVHEGRLVLADDSLPRAIDMHAHLALAYVLPTRVNLRAQTPETYHYLRLQDRLDLEPYGNRNYTPARLREMKRDLTLGAVRSGGLRATHTAPNLLRDMDDMGVAATALLPIEWPVLSRNTDEWLEACAGQERLINFGSVHPLDPRLEREVDRQAARGVHGFKMHPAVQLMPPDHRRALKLYRAAARHDLPILFHCGPVDIEPPLGRRFSLLPGYRRAVEACPDTTFILGHSGALQMEQALALANEHENVYLELSSQGLPNVRRILEEGPRDRVVFGSDWPFYHQSMPWAKVLLATEEVAADPAERAALRAAVLHDNAARLLGLPPTS